MCITSTVNVDHSITKPSAAPPASTPNSLIRDLLLAAPFVCKLTDPEAVLLAPADPLGVPTVAPTMVNCVTVLG
jgi:hypothetical protein